jgi:hypothetical protein
MGAPASERTTIHATAASLESMPERIGSGRVAQQRVMAVPEAGG